MVEAISKTALLLNASQWCADQEAAEQLTQLNTLIHRSCKIESQDSKVTKFNENSIINSKSSLKLTSGHEISVEILSTESPSPDLSSDPGQISALQSPNAPGEKNTGGLLDNLAELASKELMQMQSEKDIDSIVSPRKMRNARPRSQSNPEGMSRSAGWRVSRNTRNSSDFEAIDEEMEVDLDRTGSMPKTDGDETGSQITIPHLLQRYSETYNRNGRIGIYTKEEREAIIERFKAKRLRRVWRKKIRYNCRKNLADKRMRVKGRFVKMTAAQRAALQLQVNAENCALNANNPVAQCELHKEIRPRSASGGSEMSMLEEEDEEDADESNEDPIDAPKRVRRHSIAY